MIKVLRSQRPSLGVKLNTNIELASHKVVESDSLGQGESSCSKWSEMNSL